MKKSIIAGLLYAGAVFGVSAQPDSHAPIGVMADHSHQAGELMFGYRYMFMNMPNMVDGTTRVSAENEVVLPNGRFVVSPTDMTMQMHMPSLMYAPIDLVTVMVMVPYVVNNMSHTIAAPVAKLAGVSTFDTQTKGLGDVKVGLISSLSQFTGQDITVSLTTSLPTGSIDESGFVPVPLPAQDRHFPYPMQLGSGSYDLIPRVGYVFRADDFSVGTQLGGTIRLNDNQADYRLGNRLEGNLWFSYTLADFISASVRAHWQSWLNIEGADGRIAQQVTIPLGTKDSVPTAQPDLRAGDQLNVWLGFNLYTQQGPGKDQRLAVEVGLPAYQRLTGPQPAGEFMLVAGWQSLMFDFY